MASRDTKLNIIIEAQNRATAGFSKAERSLGSLNFNVEKVSASLRHMGKFGAIAFAALGAASAKLVNDSAQSLQIEESYRRMTESAGIATDELLKQLKKTSAGTVSSTNLMLSANRAMALGVGEDMETMTQLMEIARLKGRALGLDTTQAFNDIVTGIGRGSPLILDNLGITIKLGEAQEMYAQKLGKTAAELTDAEKKQSLLNAVLESGNKEVAKAGELQTTAAEKLQAAKAQFADTADTLGRTLIPAATKLLEAVTPVLEKVAKWIEQNPKLASNIILVSLAVAGLVAALGAIGIILPAISTALVALSGPAGIVIAILATLGGTVYQVIQILDILKNQWSETWLGIKLITAEAINGVIGVVEGMINKVVSGINGFINRINRVIKAANKYTGLDVRTIGNLDAVNLGRIDTEGIAARHIGAESNNQVVVTGNTFLSEDAAEQMGDMIMSRLKLSNQIG